MLSRLNALEKFPAHFRDAGVTFSPGAGPPSPSTVLASSGIFLVYPSVKPRQSLRNIVCFSFYICTHCLHSFLSLAFRPSPGFGFLITHTLCLPAWQGTASRAAAEQIRRRILATKD